MQTWRCTVIAIVCFSGFWDSVGSAGWPENPLSKYLSKPSVHSDIAVGPVELLANNHEELIQEAPERLSVSEYSTDYIEAEPFLQQASHWLAGICGGHCCHVDLDGCGDTCVPDFCSVDACTSHEWQEPLSAAECRQIARLIYLAQTSCDADCRRKALQQLGSYDACCYTELMMVWGQALQDCDVRVRRTAAEELKQQVRRHDCCRCLPVIQLRTALTDSDFRVRRHSAVALRGCGHQVPLWKDFCGDCVEYFSGDGNDCTTTCLDEVYPLEQPFMAPSPADPNVKLRSPILQEDAPAPPADPAPIPLPPFETPRPKNKGYVPEEAATEFRMPTRSFRELIGFRDEKNL